MTSKYSIVRFRGVRVDAYTRASLRACERQLGYNLTIIQGSYNNSVSQSAGTHDGGGAVDLAPYDHVRKVKCLRSHGWAAWYRPPIKGLWGAHIHAVQIGNAKLSPAARRQITQYRNHTNGLANYGYDSTWRPATITAYPWGSNNVGGSASMKIAGSKRYTGSQSINHGDWQTLHAERTPANKSNHVSFFFRNRKDGFVEVRGGVTGLIEGEYVDFRIYRVIHKNGENSSKMDTRSVRIYGSEAQTGTGLYSMFCEQRSVRAAPKNARWRVEARASCPGVEVHGFMSRMIQ